MRETRVSSPGRFLDNLPSNLAVKLEFAAADNLECNACDLFNIKLREVARMLGKSSTEGEYNVTVSSACNEELRREHGCGLGEFTVNKVAREPELLPPPVVLNLIPTTVN